MANKVAGMVQQIFIEKLTKEIEEMIKDPSKKFSWVKPFSGSSTPYNYVSKKKYRGLNLCLLPMGGAYMTFNQIKEKGLTLKKGAKSHLVVFWSVSQRTTSKKAKESEDEEVVDETDEITVTKVKNNFILRYYRVFHETDINDFENKDYKTRVVLSVDEKEKQLEDVLKKYCQNEDITLTIGNFGSAYYMPTADSVVVPSMENHNNNSSFLSTFAHECVHSTGNKKRLDREFGDSFGSESYSKEELVAEIGASLLLATKGIDNEFAHQNSLAYLNSWLSKVKEDINLIISASSKAQKAVDFILEKGEDEEFLSELNSKESDIA